MAERAVVNLDDSTSRETTIRVPTPSEERMSIQTQEAHQRFVSLLDNAADMVIVSADRSQRPGRRREEMALNRGAVVLAIASWQTYVEDMARAIFDTMSVGATSPLQNLIRADVLSGISRFNTPNARNSLDLLLRTGFDPLPLWAVSINWTVGRYWAGGVVTKTVDRRVTFSSTEACFELDAWLQVRHKIAHGQRFDPKDRHLLSVLSGRSKTGLTYGGATRSVALLSLTPLLPRRAQPRTPNSPDAEPSCRTAARGAHDHTPCRGGSGVVAWLP